MNSVQFVGELQKQITWQRVKYWVTLLIGDGKLSIVISRPHYAEIIWLWSADQLCCAKCKECWNFIKHNKVIYYKLMAPSQRCGYRNKMNIAQWEWYMFTMATNIHYWRALLEVRIYGSTVIDSGSVHRVPQIDRDMLHFSLTGNSQFMKALQNCQFVLYLSWLVQACINLSQLEATVTYKKSM